jgi:hypothetical protein
MTTPSPFYNLDASCILLENEVDIALWDAFPVTEGHALVNVTDPGTFLFVHARNVWDSYRGPLMEIQGVLAR